MMMSPQSYKMQHIFDSMKKLKEEKQRLNDNIEKCKKEIEALENGTATRIVSPSPKTRIRIYTEYLCEIDKLIAKRKIFCIFKNEK